MGAYIPPGWPAGVHPPGSEDFESTAIGWLLDVVPPDYRLHGVLRRYPVALATMARYHSKACVEGARQGYRTARTELAGTLPPHAIDTVLAAYRKEGARLAATAEAVDLVERALRGEVFTPKMSRPSAVPGPQSAEPGRAEPESAEARGAGPEAEEQKPARTKAEQKAAAQRTAKARAAEERPPRAKAAGVKAAEAEAAGQRSAEAQAAEEKAGGAKGGTAERGRAAARRDSGGRGRSDLART